MLKRPALFLLVIVGWLLVWPNNNLLAQSDSSPEFSLTVDNIRAPNTCTPAGWTITYDRTTTFSNLNPSPPMRYVVQYVNNDLNFVHYWESGYSAYVQDYWVTAGTEQGARTNGVYTIPLWTDTYQAETIEYILLDNTAIWEVRATLTCENGEVVASDLISKPTQRTRDTLPEFTQNLVLALDDIPRYENPYTQTGYLGTIKACQIFFITHIYLPRASISVWARESFTGHDMLLAEGSTRLPLIDVTENYGQLGGQPILPACVPRPHPEHHYHE